MSVKRKLENALGYDHHGVPSSKYAATEINLTGIIHYRQFYAALVTIQESSQEILRYWCERLEDKTFIIVPPKEAGENSLNVFEALVTKVRGNFDHTLVNQIDRKIGSTHDFRERLLEAMLRRGELFSLLGLHTLKLAFYGYNNLIVRLLDAKPLWVSEGPVPLVYGKLPVVSHAIIVNDAVALKDIFKRMHLGIWAYRGWFMTALPQVLLVAAHYRNLFALTLMMEYFPDYLFPTSLHHEICQVKLPRVKNPITADIIYLKQDDACDTLEIMEVRGKMFSELLNSLTTLLKGKIRNYLNRLFPMVLVDIIEGYTS